MKLFSKLFASKAVRAGSLAAWLALASGGLAPQARANDYPGPIAPVVLPASEVKDAITARRLRVPEHKRIAELAKARGLRVYLFGGTAANFARYVKWSVESEKGLREFRAGYFTYDFTKTYRENQDLDIVISRVDGKPETREEIVEFQKALESEFPYFQSQKTVWEVRGFRTKNGDKEALFDDWDFANQHSDTQSTGLVELTEPPQGESVVRDSRDWNSENSRFLSDLASDHIRLYFSKNHAQTARAAKGENDPIVEVLRLIRKAVQSGASIDAESMSHMRKIAQEFDPERSLNSYSRKRALREAEKIALNAIDLEHAWNLLDHLGLRQKLIRIGGDAQDVESVAWKLSREPLRSTYEEASKRIRWQGKPTGRTARDLNITTVAHATRTIDAYLSIASSPFARPNFFYSRGGGFRESAAEGDGVYAALGTKGYGPYSVVLSVDPNAREGIDFELHFGKFITINNSSAFKLIPQDFNPDADEAIKALFGTELADEGVLLERIVRWMKAVNLSSEHRQVLADEFLKMLEGSVDRYSFAPSFSAQKMHYLTELGELFVDRIPENKIFEALLMVRAGKAVEASIGRTDYPSLGRARDNLAEIIERRVSGSGFYAEMVQGLERDAIAFVAKLLSAQITGDIIHRGLARLGNERPDLALKFSMVPSNNFLYAYWMSKEFYDARKVDWQANQKAVFTAAFLSREIEKLYVAEAEKLIDQLKSDFSDWRGAIRSVFSNPHAKNHPELVERLIDIDRPHLWGEFARVTAANNLIWVERAIERIPNVNVRNRDDAVSSVMQFFRTPEQKEHHRTALGRMNEFVCSLKLSYGSSTLQEYIKVFTPEIGWLPTAELRDFLEKADSWETLSAIHYFLKELKDRPKEWDALYAASKISSREKRQKYLASRLESGSSLSGVCSRFLLRTGDFFNRK